MIFPEKRNDISAKRRRAAALCLCGAFVILLILAPIPAQAAPAAALDVESNQAVLDFPNTISFQLTVGHSAEIERIVLEYGVDKLACGEVVSKAFPDFTPAARVEAEWVWDMRQSGSEPPGANIWWQWRVTDSHGGEQLVGRQEIRWLDSVHAWRETSTDSITAHWYEGELDYGEDMLASAVGSIQQIDELIDLKPDGMIHLYLYGSYEDLQDAVLYEAGWTGGVSYGEHNIIILGIPSGDEEWGKTAIAHELMHNVVDRFTFSCLVRIPSWIQEGLAMVSEGGPGEDGMAVLQRAIDRNTIFPLRSLGGGFPEDSDQARLAYYQSYSVVDFLIRKGDAPRVRSLLASMGDGTTADDALRDLYGFNVDGLDAAWRESVGAEPLTQEDLAPTPTSTAVPTFPPVSVNPGDLAPTSTDLPAAPGTTGGGLLPSTPILLILCICLFCIVGLGGIAILAIFALARRKQ